MNSRQTFLESFSPRVDITQARVNGIGGNGRARGIEALTATMSPYSQYGNSIARTQEEVRHFSYWNYVAINLKARQASSPFPMLSYSASRQDQGGNAGRQSLQNSFLTESQRSWVRQSYGLIQSNQEDLKPLPESHPFYTLLCDPNPEDTWNEFAYEHFLFLDLTGLSYWWVVPNGIGLPSQIVVVPTQWVTPEYNRDGTVRQYNVTPQGSSYRLLEIPPEEMILSRKKSPHNKRDGYSGLSASGKWTDNVESIEDARRNSFSNGGNPDLLIKLGESYSDPDDGVIARIKEKFMRRFSGTKHYGEPQVVPPGIDIEKWSHAPKEMDFASTGDQARDNNLALHGTPKVLAGITTDVNRATVEGANIVFSQTQINPMLRHFAGTLTWLGGRFDPRIKVWFEDQTPKNAEQELREDQADFAMGALTPDERRQKRGRKPIGEPMYESGFLAAGLQPLSQELIDEAQERADEIAGMESGDAGDTEDDVEDDVEDSTKDDTEDKPAAKPKGDKSKPSVKGKQSLPAVQSIFG